MPCRLNAHTERKSLDEPIKSLPGPVVDPSCDSICNDCLKSLQKRKVPKYALARGLWVGPVPDVLTCLTFAEKLLVARVRTSRYVVRVASGLYRLSGNAIAFSIPTPKIYKELPPPRDELDEVLAFIFTAPVKPLEEQMKNVPLFVSHKRVWNALEWLKLNHGDYADLVLSEKNMKTYEDNKIAVPVVYQKADSDGNKNPESTAVHDCEEEEGITSGPLPFVAHGLTGLDLLSMSPEAFKAAETDISVLGSK